MNRQMHSEWIRSRRPFLAVLLLLALVLVVTGAEAAPGQWEYTGSLSVRRDGHTATLLPNGRVLAAGGYDGGVIGVLNSAESFDPATGTWALTGEMNEARYNHTATLLPDGRVLVAGGRDDGFVELKSAELYDPATGSWTPTGEMSVRRQEHTATLLLDGRVLVVGGLSPSAPGAWLDSAELYDPATGTWTLAGVLSVPRIGHTATRLPDGRVLVAGGLDPSGTNALKSAELFDPVTGLWTATNDMNEPRLQPGSVLLPGGKVLVAGGSNVPYPTAPYLPVSAAELFDPATESWTPTGDMVQGRQDPQVILFSNGRAFFIGGEVRGSVPYTEWYNPATGVWTDAGNMMSDRSDHTANLLPDGRVLVAGGWSADLPGPTYRLQSAELYAPPACPALPGNIVQNSCFESGEAPWAFYTNGWGAFETTTPAYDGSFAARVEVSSAASNVQLYQAWLPLEPNQHYRLYFAAKSNNGRDMSLYVHKHVSPYTNYGLAGQVVNLTTEWQQFSIDFTTNSTAAGDARLRFWLAPYATAGTVYGIDNVYLLKVIDGAPPPPDPDPTDPLAPPPGHCSAPVVGNVVANPGFEASALTPWAFYTNGRGYAARDTGTAYECSASSKVAIQQEGSNVQLYQAWLTLQPNTAYQLRLAAKSGDGRDMRVYVHQHVSPYTNYGLNGLLLDLTTEWQVFVVQFTTTGFSTPVWDGRLRFWLAESDAANATYYVDDVVLAPLNSSSTMSAASLTGLATRDSAITLPQRSPALAGGQAAGQFLQSGYFIDDDDAGRAQGAFLPPPKKGSDSCGAARPSRAVLWPADGRLVAVKIVGAGKPVWLAISGIWQDEPVGAEADGGVEPQDFAALLRAERDAGGNGRVYHVSFEAVYRDGSRCAHEVLVMVPPARDRASVAVDDGPLANSMLP